MSRKINVLIYRTEAIDAAKSSALDEKMKKKIVSALSSCRA
jgi:hypothetical protein